MSNPEPYPQPSGPADNHSDEYLRVTVCICGCSYAWHNNPEKSCQGSLGDSNCPCEHWSQRYLWGSSRFIVDACSCGHAWKMHGHGLDKPCVKIPDCGCPSYDPWREPPVHSIMRCPRDENCPACEKLFVQEDERATRLLEDQAGARGDLTRAVTQLEKVHATLMDLGSRLSSKPDEAYENTIPAYPLTARRLREIEARWLPVADYLCGVASLDIDDPVGYVKELYDEIALLREQLEAEQTASNCCPSCGQLLPNHAIGCGNPHVEIEQLRESLESALADCDGEFETWRTTNSELRKAQAEVERLRTLLNRCDGLFCNNGIPSEVEWAMEVSALLIEIRDDAPAIEPDEYAAEVLPRWSDMCTCGHQRDRHSLYQDECLEWIPYTPRHKTKSFKCPCASFEDDPPEAL